MENVQADEIELRSHELLLVEGIKEDENDFCDKRMDSSQGE